MDDRPDIDETLIRLAEGTLDAEAEAAAVARLADDPAARDVVARLRAVLAGLGADAPAAPSPAVVSRLVTAFETARGVEPASSPRPAPTPAWLAALDAVVARLVFDGRSAPAIAGFRGDGAAMLAWEGSLGRVDATLTADDAAGTWRLRGQVRTEGVAGRVHAACGDDARSAVCDDHGGFVMDLPPGLHRIAVEVRDRGALVMEDVEVG